MFKDLFSLSFKLRIRNIEFRRNFIGILILLAYFVFIFIEYKDDSFRMIESILNGLSISFFALFLKVLPFVLIMDLIIKLLFKNNSLQIPAFIQKLPITKKEWNRYIGVCNIFTFWNFYVIILFSPFLFKFATVTEILEIVSLLWIGTLTNNVICFVLSNLVVKPLIKTFHLTYNFPRGNTSISWLKMEFIYIYRSKRIMMLLLIPTILFFILLWMDKEILIVCFILFIPILSLGQYLLGIEANFFNGIWTKPIHLVQILENKYLFYMLLTGIYALLLYPFIWLYQLNISQFLSIVVYVMCFVNLLLFPIALYAKRLDLNSSTFLNYQGFAVIPLIYVMILFVFSLWLYQFIFSSFENEWIASGIIFLISITSFLLRKPFLSIISACFLKNRYNNMNRFMTS